MEKRDVWERLKWNGWGEKGVQYELNQNGNVEHSRTGVELPKIIPFAKDIFGLDDLENTPSVELDDIELAEPRPNEGFVSLLKSFLSASQISFDKEQRICHAYGMSFRDLWRLRKGVITDAPDCVLYPQSHEDVERIVQAAHVHRAHLIPSGGRTNIVGATEAERIENRFVASLDLRRMNRMLWVDKKTMTACFEAGILGPDLENGLKKEGLSLGHDPDSFQWSTLGGWLATCSSGMQSDKYGDIEDMCLSLKVVTPGVGTITTPFVPRNGSGPALKHLFIGTEGVMGVITQAVMRVHKIPAKQEFHGILFPSFEHGVAAIHTMVRKESHPAMVRLYDPDETRLSFHMKPKSSKLVSAFSELLKKFLERFKNFDLQNICLMIVGVEGEVDNVNFQKKKVFKIAKEAGGFWIGQGPGKSWHEKRYDLPMLRDLLLEKGLWVDVAETAVSFSNLLLLWKDVKESVLDAFKERNAPGWIGAHISHTYTSGVCIYFHYASVQQLDKKDDVHGEEDLSIYLDAKKAATTAILRNNGALSHHHGVGYEHVPFMSRYIGKSSIKLLSDIKKTLDPASVCNPGKLLPEAGKEDMDNEDHSFYKYGFASLTDQLKQASSVRAKSAL